MKNEATYYEQLAIGAEFLAAITRDNDARIEHLKMAGTYHHRALLAGSLYRPSVVH